MNYKQFCESNPIAQATHTGLWGWRRVYDCIDLSQCKFRSAQAAGKDRKRAYSDAQSLAV